ncbi:hypothetical protein [Synechococcus sp. MU1642]|uniref:hypothetical protein n=1 Tax=Synechococcus sp. MU1642 TaxID=2508348 RepID=UPI001CF8EDAA|nr:hypothetical protein [Synechococcus sp. MU1642]
MRLNFETGLVPTARLSISNPTASLVLPSLMCEEKCLAGWKQGHTPASRFGTPAFGGGFFLPGRNPMETVINEIEFDFEQTVSIRTDVKLSKDDVKQIVSEAPAETLEEIVYQSLVADELYLRARAKEIATKLKQDALEVRRIEYWDDKGNKA